MRAVIVPRHGGADVLEVQQAPVPEPAGRASCSSRSPPRASTSSTFTGARARTPPNHRSSWAASAPGAVVALGRGSTTSPSATLVASAATASGSHATHALIDGRPGRPGAGRRWRRSVAAAAMLQGMTAHYLGDHLPGAGGQTVALVHAAAGGVGQLLVQFAKRAGARVIGTVGSEAKEAIARRGRRGRGDPLRRAADRRAGGRGPRRLRTAECTSSSTGSARPPSTRRWRRCGAAACWCSSAPRAGRCRRSTCSGSTPAVRCSSPGRRSRTTPPTATSCGGGPPRCSAPIAGGDAAHRDRRPLRPRRRATRLPRPGGPAHDRQVADRALTAKLSAHAGGEFLRERAHRLRRRPRPASRAGSAPAPSRRSRRRRSRRPRRPARRWRRRGRRRPATPGASARTRATSVCGGRRPRLSRAPVTPIVDGGVDEPAAGGRGRARSARRSRTGRPGRSGPGRAASVAASHVAGLVRDEVRRDRARARRPRRGRAAKRVDAVALDRVPVGHDHRRRAGVGHRRDRASDVADAVPRAQRRARRPRWIVGPSITGSL